MTLLVGDALSAGGDEIAAKEYYEKITNSNSEPNFTVTPKALFKIGLLEAKNRHYATAINYFNEVVQHPKSSSRIQDKSKKWIVQLSLLKDDKKTDRQKVMGELGVAEDVEVKDMVEAYDALSFKSPELAGIYSAIIPGMGQLYINRPRDAAASFILNGLFIWGIVESFRQDNQPVGITLLVFESGWYAGNIYSAISGAEKHNRSLKDKFMKRISIGLNIHQAKLGAGSEILLSYNF